MHKALISVIILCLISCSNVLTYKNRFFFGERNYIKKDEYQTFSQQVYYNRPFCIDEEYCHCLEIKIFDKENAIRKKNLNIEQDTNIINIQYSIFSIWNWSDENYKITGHVKIIKWNENKVVMKENIYIDDIRRERKIKFSGTRAFTYPKRRKYNRRDLFCF